ncbi:MAG TPA: hypothetical protein VJV79_26405 [Polyangiaceae bacterium]|nr:hypothetical protein [Polyangiaceae bacterium]
MSSALGSLSGIALRGRLLVVILLLGLTLPVFALRKLSRAYADALGSGIAARLSAVVPTLRPSIEEGWAEGQEQQEEQEQEEPQFMIAPGVRGAAFDATRTDPRVRARARATRPSGIRVSAAQVLALAARRAMPSAVFVKATAQRPAGLRLSGVSALGIGIQDGDVLTEAAGQKASSVAAVVGVVLAARARQAAEISGRFYRGGVPFLLTVEQPYPKVPVPG